MQTFYIMIDDNTNDEKIALSLQIVDISDIFYEAEAFWVETSS